MALTLLASHHCFKPVPCHDVSHLFKGFSSNIVLEILHRCLSTTDQSCRVMVRRISVNLAVYGLEFTVGPPVLQVSILNQLFVGNSQWRTVLEFTHFRLQCSIVPSSLDEDNSLSNPARRYTTDLNTSRFLGEGLYPSI